MEQQRLSLFLSSCESNQGEKTQNVGMTLGNPFLFSEVLFIPLFCEILTYTYFLTACSKLFEVFLRVHYALHESPTIIQHSHGATVLRTFSYHAL